MFQYYYDRASEIANERIAEADQWRRARTEPRPRRASLLDRGRRLGALAAAGMARRLDECAAKEAFQRLAPDGRPEVGA